MVDSLLQKLLEQSPIVMVMGVVIYAQHRMYGDLSKYNREQDSKIADILSTIVPVVHGLKEGMLRSGDAQDRNLHEISSGHERIHDRLALMSEAIAKLDITINAFMDHIKAQRK